jgi:hypothetical protein
LLDGASELRGVGVHVAFEALRDLSVGGH